MSDFAHLGAILADDWSRQKEDLIKLAEPDLSARELADIAAGIADDYAREVAATVAQVRLRERPFIVDWPALARWRDSVLREPRRHPQQVVAAALEAMALECDLAGYTDLAQKARAQAEAVVLGRRVAADREYAT